MEGSRATGRGGGQTSELLEQQHGELEEKGALQSKR